MIKLVLTAVLSFSTLFLAGQNFEYGIKGGVNVSSLDNEGSDFDTYETKIGLNIGGYCLIKLTEKYGIKTELLYSMEGANFKGSDAYVRLNRLSIPLLISYNLNQKFYLEAGPEVKIQVGFDTNIPSSLVDVESIYEPLDYGGSIGLGFRPFDKVGISLRNYFGLKHHSKIDLTDDFGNVTNEIKSDRSNVLSLSINYSLN